MLKLIQLISISTNRNNWKVTHHHKFCINKYKIRSNIGTVAQTNSRSFSPAGWN